MQTGKKHGMVTMNDSLSQLVKKKIVDAEGGLHQGDRQGGAREQLQEERHRYFVGPLRPAGTGRRTDRLTRPVSLQVLDVAAGDALARAIAVVEQGELLIYPTDTLYALGGAALGVQAALRVRRAKGRDDGKPLPLVAADTSSVGRLVRLFPAGAERLAARFWPGPLTLVLPSAACVADAVTAGSGTVAIRVPGLAFTRALCAAAGPLISTSANLQGAPPPLTCAAAVAALGAEVSLALDGGTALPQPSTIVDATGPDPRLLREGAVPWAAVLHAWG